MKAMIVIDAWDSRQVSNSFFQSAHEEMIQNIRRVMQILPYAVFANYNSERYAPHPNLEQGPWSDTDRCCFSIDHDHVVTWLNQRGVTDLYFAGASMPGCVDNRPLGLRHIGEYRKHIIMDCVLHTTSLHPTVLGMTHDTYQKTYGDAKQYGWHLTWSNQL